MNTTPKQQDADGSSVASASGSRSLESTVLGVAPAPLPENVSTSAPPVASSALPRAAVAAAPMIPVAETPVAPPSQPRAAYREPPSADIGSTMPVLLQRPIAARAPEPGPVDAGVQRTALTSDYLREAREAALAKVAAESGRVEPAPPARAEPISAVWVEPASAVESEHDAPVHTRRSIPSPGYDGDGFSTTGGGAGPNSSRGFEPVPVVRAPLSESMTSGLGPVVDVGGGRSSFPPALPRRPQARTSRGGAARWLLLLGSVAAVTAGVVWFGAQFLKNQRAGARASAMTAVEAAASPAAGAESSALLANRPAPEVPDIPGRATVVSATGAPGSIPDGDAPGAGALSQSQLAATAGRHVLAGNYAEALPLYQQLERNWPMNSSYSAMARLLKKKVGATSDTQTVTPATSSKP